MSKLNEVARKAGDLLNLTVNVEFDQSIKKYVVTKRNKILYIGGEQDCNQFLKNNTMGFMVRHKPWYGLFILNWTKQMKKPTRIDPGGLFSFINP